MSNEARAEAPRTISNPFANDQVTRSPQVVTAHNTNTSRRRFGIIPLCIGASRVVHAKEGRRHIYEARELRVEAARAQNDGRTLTVACVCFECRKMYPDFEALAADHPSIAVMAENEESHTWAYWCDDKYDAKGAESVESLKLEIKALQTAHRSCVQGIGKLQDVESIMKERKRATEIEGMIKESRDKLRSEEDNIIGLLSETPFTA